ncbi:hypothetical protein ACVJGC_005479 [Bradyrhizobium diazoefficiens]
MKPDRQPTPTADVQPVTVDLSAASLTVGGNTARHDLLTTLLLLALARPQPLARVSDEMLMTEIARVVGDDEFAACDLFAKPELKRVLAGTNARKLGRRLARLERRGAVDGLRIIIERIGADRAGLIWRICEFP